MTNKEKYENLYLILKNNKNSMTSDKALSELIEFCHYLLIDNELLQKNINNQFNSLNEQIKKLEKDNENLREINNNLLKRYSKKLTFMERFRGRLQ